MALTRVAHMDRTHDLTDEERHAFGGMKPPMGENGQLLIEGALEAWKAERLQEYRVRQYESLVQAEKAMVQSVQEVERQRDVFAAQLRETRTQLARLREALAQ